tara:strand:- start:2958 stop:3710 length:753 start_codon:yes stop_codon:yes gene_type:complete
MASIFLPKHIELVITSYGGVGTTFIISHLSRYLKTNNPEDKDYFKHSSLPLISSNPNIKFVYIYGNPMLAVISLFRRNYFKDHLSKLQRWNKGNIDSIFYNLSIEDYAKNGIDLLDLSGHFYNWYDKHLFYQTLFIRYETLHENLDILFNFCEIPSKHIDNFPKRKYRVSNFHNYPKEVIDGLTNIYGSFNQELMNLEDVELRIPKKHYNDTNLYLKNPYRRAIIIGMLEKYFPKTRKIIKKSIRYKNSI